MLNQFKKNIKKKLKKISKDYKIYDYSLKKSQYAINNCLFNTKAIEYKSIDKMNNFIYNYGINKITNKKIKTINSISKNKSLNGEVGIKNINTELELGNNDSKALEKQIEYDCRSLVRDIRDYLNSPNHEVKNCFDVNQGNYFIIRFPVFGGRLRIKFDKDYSSTYYWCGNYRNVELFLCGNVKNVDRQICPNRGKYTWDPSATGASVKLFDKIEEYVKTNEKIYSKDIDFGVLKNHLKRTTARGETNFGWKDFLVICDKKEVTEDGIIKIFGSPVLVTANTDFGYGWYKLTEKKTYDDSEFYEYDNGEFTGKILYLNKSNRRQEQNKELLIPIEKDVHEIYNRISIYNYDNKTYFKTSKIGSRFYSIKNKKFNDNKQILLKTKLSQCQDLLGICITKDLLYNNF